MYTTLYLYVYRYLYVFDFKIQITIVYPYWLIIISVILIVVGSQSPIYLLPNKSIFCKKLFIFVYFYTLVKLYLTPLKGQNIHANAVCT